MALANSGLLIVPAPAPLVPTGAEGCIPIPQTAYLCAGARRRAELLTPTVSDICQEIEPTKSLGRPALKAGPSSRVGTRATKIRNYLLGQVNRALASSSACTSSVLSAHFIAAALSTACSADLIPGIGNVPLAVSQFNATCDGVAS